MILLEPIWAILLLPWLLFELGFFGGASSGGATARRADVRRAAVRRAWGWHRTLRLVVWGLLLAALCRPAWLVPQRGGTVVALVDRSASMPVDSASTAGEILERLAAERGPRDRLAVLSFAEDTALEGGWVEGAFDGFQGMVGQGQSHLADAVEGALAVLGDQDAGRLLVISDGRWTGRNPAEAGGRATLRGIPIDYRLLERPPVGDLAIERLDAPQEVSPGEAFLISAWVHAPVPQTVAYELRRGDTVLSRGRRALTAGSQRMVFRDRATGSGTEAYRLRIEGIREGADTSGAGDPVLENNSARFLVSVQGPRPVLVVSDTPGLANLLAAGGLTVRRVPVDTFRRTIDDSPLGTLGGVSAVVLENVGAHRLGDFALDHLAIWVRQSGGGLWMTGGPQSFGPGGYFGSPLDPLLPVSMELRQEHRKAPLAMSIVLDRSGSMAVPTASGHTKMDLANRATVEVLDLLMPSDELSVIAVDSEPHTVVSLGPVGTDRRSLRDRTLSINSMGGGIFVYKALDAAARELVNAQASVRHILLFADAADAERPGNYDGLLFELRKAGVTVSVIGLGSPVDPDAGLLEDIAIRGEGRIFFTENAEELPRLFTQETFTVARNTFVEEAAPWRFAGGTAFFGLDGPPGGWGTPPALGGFNLTYLRPEATVAALVEGDTGAPLIAGWQVGEGRVAVFTGEADGSFTGALARWDSVGELLTGLGRWVAGDDSGEVAGMLVTQRVERGAVQVLLHLDPERSVDPFVRPPALGTLRGSPGAPPEAEEVGFRWRDPDTLEATLDLVGDEVLLNTVSLGEESTTLAPLRLPLSPEFQTETGQIAAVGVVSDAGPPETGPLRDGPRALEAMAKSTGGRQRFDVSGIWEEFERRPTPLELTPFLLLLAITLFLLQIFERRTGLLSVAGSRVRASTARRPVDVPGREAVAPSRGPVDRSKAEDAGSSAPKTPRDPSPEDHSPEDHSPQDRSLQDRNLQDQSAAQDQQTAQNTSRGNEGETNEGGVVGALGLARRRARQRQSSSER